MLAAFWSAFGVLAVLVLRWEGTSRLDDAIWKYVVEHRQPWLTTTLGVVNQLGSLVVLVPLLLAVGLWVGLLGLPRSARAGRCPRRLAARCGVARRRARRVRLREGRAMQSGPRAPCTGAVVTRQQTPCGRDDSNLAPDALRDHSCRPQRENQEPEPHPVGDEDAGRVGGEVRHEEGDRRVADHEGERGRQSESAVSPCIPFRRVPGQEARMRRSAQPPAPTTGTRSARPRAGRGPGGVLR